MTKVHTTNSNPLVSGSKRSSWSFLFFVFLLLVVGSSVFVTWEQSALRAEKERLTEIIERLDSATQQLAEKDGYDRRNALLSAQTILGAAEQYRVNWSTIYNDVTTLEKNNIVFYNINAGRDKKFNISGLTSHMSSLSTLLDELKNNPKFEDPFISQVGEVRSGDKKAFNFSLSFEYKEI